MYVLDERLGRRRFLKVLGSAAGVATVGGSAGCASFGSAPRPLAANAAGEAAWGREAGEWIPSCCNMCGGQCGILTHVVNGTVTKIEPNHWNPNNYGNISTDFFEGYTEEFGARDGGAICAKGNAGVMQLYDPDRIKTPLKRTNPDRTPGADPRWQELSWDQALDEIAGKMKALRDGGEAHKLLWFSEDHSFVHPQQDFCKLFGTPNYHNHSNLCDVSRKATYRTVMGDERPLADFIQSKYIMLFGWNPTSAIKWIHLPRIITQGIERGARLVVVDPYLSDTAVKAHEWVPIRPATDGALALALGHVIIRDRLYDAEFVANWSVGFEEYSAYVRDKTPEWAEAITTVPARTIERLARELATTKPALVDVWSGPGQHSNGVQGGRAIALLNALIGGFDRAGGMMVPARAGEKHQEVEAPEVLEPTRNQPRFDERGKYPLSHGSGVYTQAFTNLADGTGPYQPRMAVVVFQNPMMAVPGTQKVAVALAKLETLVVIDTMLSETAMMADYVLPGTVYLERYDLTTHWVTWSAVGLRQPVVKPLFGQPAEYEIVAALGRRLDLRTREGVPFFEVGPASGRPIPELTAWYEEYLSKELLTGGPRMSLAELKALPGAVWVDRKGTTYQKYAAQLAPDKLAAAWFDGPRGRDGTAIYDKPKDQGGKRIGTIIRGKAVRGFMTPSGKVEFMASSLAGKTGADGRSVDALPVFRPRDWMPSPEYPLYLINWKEASHTHSRTQNNPILLERKPWAPLVIHPDTAARRGIGEGDVVRVESPFGTAEGVAKISKRIHPEVVGLQHGFGHTALGRRARGRGMSDATLRPMRSDPLSGQAMHKETCVRLTRVRAGIVT
jgi:thiosulfate reductase/polysulfide reductase chain A